MKLNTPLKLARIAARVADDKLGKNITILDVRGHSSVTDSFLFVTANSHLHVRSLEDALREALRIAGAQLQRTDGQRGHVWRVLDYGILMIHIMDEKAREFYAIERLWDQAKKVSPGLAKPKPPKKKARAKTTRR